MIAFFYEIVLWFLLIISMPKIFYQYFKNGKYRTSWKQRLGKNYPKINKNGKKLIWIHACSVGETKAVALLSKKLKTENTTLICSSTTETGQAEAKRSINADYFVYLPIDSQFIIKPIIQKLKPDLLLLSESEFWYNFLKHSSKYGAKVCLVNGKISKKSLGRFNHFPGFSKAIFENVDLFCVQNEGYKKDFIQLNIPEIKIKVTGNLKFDEENSQMSSEQLSEWKLHLGIQPTDQVIVVGSTHHPEEKLILNSLQSLWSKFPQLKVIFVPRHPERFAEVADLLHTSNLSFNRYSDKNKKKDAKVILVDAMGVLRKCYQIADIALICGSFTPKVGGHNIIEPCEYGVPIIFGPYMHTQQELVELVKRYRAGLQVEEGALRDTLKGLLTNPEERKEYGEGGKKLVRERRGGTDKTLEEIHAVSSFL